PVSNCTRGSVGEIVDRDHSRDCAAERHRSWSYSEPFIERPAFVRLHVRKSYITQLCHRHHTGNRFTNQGEHLARSGVKDKRLIVNNKILVKRESSRSSFYDNRRIDTINPIRDLMDVCP